MGFFFRASVIISALSLFCLFFQDNGTLGFKLTLTTLFIGIIVAIISGVIIYKKERHL